jgi:hypothetical protein
MAALGQVLACMQVADLHLAKKAGQLMSPSGTKSCVEVVLELRI